MASTKGNVKPNEYAKHLRKYGKRKVNKRIRKQFKNSSLSGKDDGA
jgi:hypothetical protein